MFVCPECGLSADASGFCTEHGVALAPVDDPLLGTTVGSWRIARLLGQGGMGRVYLAVQPRIGSRVAIKVLSPEGGIGAATVERFFAEARAVNVIRHEGIVNVIDLAALPDGRPYIVMEYLDGVPLSALFDAERRLPIGSVVQLIREILAALEAAHTRGIVHRDLKPDNIFVTSAGRAKVLDFGIAKLLPDIATLSQGTRTGALLGTPHYMSPEQARGHSADARSDIYAVGLILYEGVTGQRVIRGQTLYEVLREHVETEPPPPRSLRGDLPAALEAAVLRALQKAPEHRFQSAAEMSEALASAAQFLEPAEFASLGVAGVAPPALRSGSASGHGIEPTMPGYTNTLGASSRGTVSAPSASPAVGIAVAAGLGLLGLGLVGAAAAGLFFLLRTSPSPAPPTPAATPAPTVGSVPTAAPLEPAAESLAGTYDIVAGTNPGQPGQYRGSVTFTDKAPRFYDIEWNVRNSPPYTGIGIHRDHVLGVGWGLGTFYGVAVYQVSGSKLSGRWATSRTGSVLGREELVGAAELGGTYQITDAWSPASGKPYTGTVTLRRRGELFDVTWKLDRETTNGIGLRDGNVLVVAFGQTGAGVVLYTTKGKRLEGRWTQVGAQTTALGTETLARR